MPNQEQSRFKEQADRDIAQKRSLDKAQQKARETFPGTNFEDLPFLEKMGVIYSQAEQKGLKLIRLNEERPATPAEIAAVIKIKNKRL